MERSAAENAAHAAKLGFTPPPPAKPLFPLTAKAAHLARDPAITGVFAQHYVTNGFNSLAAARAVGFINPSPTFAASLARSKAVREHIAELMGPLSLEHEISPERVKAELARIAFGDVRGLFTETGALKPVTEIDDDTAAGIASIEVEVKRTRTETGDPDDPDSVPTATERTETSVVKIKRFDRIAALKILAQHTKVIGDDVADGLNSLAAALAGRLDAAKRRTQDTQDVTDIEPNVASPAPAPALVPGRKPVIQSLPDYDLDLDLDLQPVEPDPQPPEGTRHEDADDLY